MTTTPAAQNARPRAGHGAASAVPAYPHVRRRRARLLTRSGGRTDYDNRAVAMDGMTGKGLAHG